MIFLSLVLATLTSQAGHPASVVTISAAELARAQRLTIGRQPLWRIGGDAEGPYSFARLVGGTFMREGRVALLEGNPPQVRVYDAAGKHAVSFGRRGRGPGEFEQVQRIVPHVGDSLVVSQISRVSVFDARGTHARTISTANAGVGLAMVSRMFPDGSMLASLRPLPVARDCPEGVERSSSRMAILTPSAAAILRDLGNRRGGEAIVARFDRGIAMHVRAFSAGHLLDASDNLVYSMQSELPRLEVINASTGALLRIVSIDLTPRPVSTRDKAEFADWLRASTKDPQIEAAFLRVMTYPEQMPYFDQLRWSQDGIVRLRRYVARLDSAAQWLSLTPGGRLLSLIDLPAKVRVLDFDRDRVLVVERDADDLEYVAYTSWYPRSRSRWSSNRRVITL